METESTTAQDTSPKSNTQQATDLSRVFLSTACEVLGGVNRASAEAFSTLSEHLTPEKVNESGLPTKIVEGVLRGNAKFFEELSHSTAKVAETIKSRQK